MKQRCSHTVLSLLLVLFVGFGTAFAGVPLCSADCLDCKPVVSCCGEMDGGPTSAHGGTTGHLPEGGDCSHGNACLDGLLPGDSSPAAALTVQYDLSALQDPPSQVILQNLVVKHAIPVPCYLTPDQSPPLFLQHCSFLI